MEKVTEERVPVSYDYHYIGVAPCNKTCKLYFRIGQYASQPLLFRRTVYSNLLNKAL